MAPMKANFYNKKKIKYLNMLKSGKPKRNSKGEIVRDAPFRKRTAPTARIESTLSLFKDSKSVSQNDLERYRDATLAKGPYEVLLSTGTVPYSMIAGDVAPKKSRDLSQCFGTPGSGKKPRSPPKSYEEILSRRMSSACFSAKGAAEAFEGEDGGATVAQHCPGQSKRAWNELYKVLDASDVIVHVLDARDPMGTICRRLEAYVSEQARHKHLMYLINKVDLVPTSVTASWLRALSKKHPAVAFQAGSLDNVYGKSNLINVFRQLKSLYSKPDISIGFIGYPNVGKSSIINALRDKKVCKAAPVPGETKVWQYVTLMGGIYLIDSPGVVPVADYKQAVLRGAVRIENLADPDLYVKDVIDKAGKGVIERTYGIVFNDMDDFFEKMAVRYKRVMKGGVPNVDLISKHVLYDWLRGNIPYFVQPPAIASETAPASV